MFRALQLNPIPRVPQVSAPHLSRIELALDSMARLPNNNSVLVEGVSEDDDDSLPIDEPGGRSSEATLLLLPPPMGGDPCRSCGSVDII